MTPSMSCLRGRLYDKNEALAAFLWARYGDRVEEIEKIAASRPLNIVECVDSHRRGMILRQYAAGTIVEHHGTNSVFQGTSGSDCVMPPGVIAVECMRHNAMLMLPALKSVWDLRDVVCGMPGFDWVPAAFSLSLLSAERRALMHVSLRGRAIVWMKNERVNPQPIVYAVDISSCIPRSGRWYGCEPWFVQTLQMVRITRVRVRGRNRWRVCVFVGLTNMFDVPRSVTSSHTYVFRSRPLQMLMAGHITQIELACGLVCMLWGHGYTMLPRIRMSESAWKSYDLTSHRRTHAYVVDG